MRATFLNKKNPLATSTFTTFSLTVTILTRRQLMGNHLRKSIVDVVELLVFEGHVAPTYATSSELHWFHYPFPKLGAPFPGREQHFAQKSRVTATF